MSYNGTIKSFVAVKGYGFIESPATFSYYGKDIIVFKSDLPEGFANPGDTCTFNVVEEHNGPRATQVQMQVRSMSSSKGNAKGKDKQRPMTRMPPPPPTVAMVNGGRMHPPVSAPAADIYAPSFVGTVKSIDPRSGWGAIACDMTFSLYGTDVFFTKEVAPHVRNGEEVRFSLKVEPRGGLSALEVTPLRAYAQSPKVQVPMYPVQVPMYPQTGKAVSKDHVYIGTVKSYSAEKGWGHISCDATKKIYQRDIFLQSGQVEAVGGQIPLGSYVSFKVSSDAKGPKATDFRVIPPEYIGADGYPGKQISGIIKSFNESKGWGFVSGDEILEVFGKDIFLNKRELDGDMPKQGDQVFFHVEIDKDGQAQAKSIQIGGYPAAVKRQRLV